MIIVPQNAEQFRLMGAFLGMTAGVKPSPELVMVGWFDQEKKSLKMCVGLDTFIGKTCHIHVGMAPEFHFTPREVLDKVFNFAFGTEEGQAAREMIIGVVNSKNAAALKYDLHLGFKELFRIPKMHDDDGDVVILGMTRDECKYLDQKEAA